MNITLIIEGRIPAIYYGGTERVLYDLGHSLSEMGHRVNIIATRGSTAPFARIIERNPEVDITSQIPADTEIVHFQDSTPPHDCIEFPYIVTGNGNRLNLSPQAMERCVFVSRNHAEHHGCRAFVHNGLDWDSMYPDVDLTKRRKGFHFLGKAAWRLKNVRGAIDMVRSIPHETLEVIGGHRLNLKMGFRFTANPRIHFHGMADNALKQKVIQQSRGLIFPVLWNEPFGLAMTESMYLGAPVFGTVWGSLPEIVTPETGFLTDSKEEMIERMMTADFSPATCNEYARTYFNADVMTRKYLEYYEEVISGRTLNPLPIKPDANPMQRFTMH